MTAESFGATHDIAEQVMTKLRELNIPATAPNYATWYAYFSAENEDLRRTVDVLLTNKQTFTEKLCEELHLQFFKDINPADRIAGAGGRIEQNIGRVLEFISTAGDTAEEYGNSLESFSGVLDDGPSDRLSGMVSQIASATRSMVEQNNVLKGQLEQSSDEIAELRTELETIRHEAMTDSLTGVGNRKRFDDTLHEAAQSAMENGHELSLLLLDIDHFKRFNDTYGHQSGDQVLRLVGQILREGVKGRDTPCRYGGEEFAILLPQTNLEGSVKVANQIRTSVASKKIVRKSSGEKLAQITLSAGVAQFNFGEPLSQFVERADNALYAAKQQGRNRVIAHPVQSPKLAAAS